MTRFRILLFFIVLLGLISGCAKQNVPDTRAEDERVIRELEIEAWKALEAKDLGRLTSFYADDALAFYPNIPLLTGKDAIRERWKNNFAKPDFAISGQSLKVHVSGSGDLAYAHGISTSTVNDATGKPKTDKGKYVAVYRKQPDGKWKLAIDIANSDLPIRTK